MLCTQCAVCENKLLITYQRVQDDCLMNCYCLFTDGDVNSFQSGIHCRITVDLVNFSALYAFLKMQMFDIPLELV